MPCCAANSTSGSAPIVALLKRNTDESPCSPITHAWMLRGCTPHSLASRSSKRSVSSDVPEPITDTERPVPAAHQVLGEDVERIGHDDDHAREPAGLHRGRGVVEDLDVGLEHVEAGLARLHVAPTVMMVTSSGSNSS